MPHFDEEALFEQLLAEEGFQTDTERPIQPRPAALPTPLSFAQTRLWFLQALDQQDPSYNINGAFMLEGSLDLAKLEAALRAVVGHHEILRTGFREQQGVPASFVFDMADLPDLFQVNDFSNEDPMRLQDRLRDEADALWHRPFDLTRDGVFRLLVLKLEDQRHAAIFSVHHIAFDAWSMGIFVRDWSACYQQLVKDEALPVMSHLQYADFAYYQVQEQTPDRQQQGLQYWCDLLQDAPRHLPLKGDRPLPEVQSYRGGREKQRFTGAFSGQLKAFAAEHECSPFMLLHTAFAVLLARFSDTRDLVIGVPIAGRERPELEDIIGFFANTLALRTQLVEGDFVETLALSRARILEAFEHQDVAFEQVVHLLQPDRSLQHTPLFQVMFSLQNTPSREAEVAGLKIMPLDLAQHSAKFLLFLAMAETPGGFVAEWEYNADVFDGASIRHMADCFETLLASILETPQRAWAQLNLVPASQRKVLLAQWQPAVMALDETPIAQRILQQASKLENQSAVVCGMSDDTLSYAQLHAQALRFAQVLLDKHLPAESAIAVYLNRHPQLVSVLLGIHLAGCCYVPLDPQFPSARNRLILYQAQPRLVITQSDLAADLADVSEQDWFYVDLEDLPQPATHAALPSPLPDALSHIIYTSGSTGVPKGAAITQRGVAALFDWSRNSFDPQDWQAVWAGTSLGFDLSVFEIWLTLAHGGTVFLGRDVLALEESPHRDQVTLVNTVPSAMTALLRLQALPSAVRTVNLAGEALPPSLARDLFALGSVHTVNNLYGPSEDTTYSTWAAQASGAPITIGQAIHHTRAYVLDRLHQLCPVGVPGELYLAGEGLARGYVGAPKVTAARFLPNAFGAAGSRCYRTGDCVRLDRQGQLHYLNRLDHQLKIRGFRIESGEIEALLDQNEAVQESLVQAFRPRESGDPQLVAYFVPSATFMAEQQSDAATEAHLDQWQKAWESIYSGDQRGSDALDLTGWVDSYSGSDIPQAQMLAWVEQTVERILALKPRCVLEIGCGTGLLMWRIAPQVERFVGTDISPTVLDRVRQNITSEAWQDRVDFAVCAAHELSRLGGETFDVIVLNSVMQYFPSHSYFEDVLRQASACLADNGTLFLGDVRELSWLNAFHLDIAATRLGGQTAVADLLQEATRGVRQERELVVRSEWLASEAMAELGFQSAAVQLKTADTLNELVRFRVDVVLSKAAAHMAWPQNSYSALNEDFYEALAQTQDDVVWVRGVENANVGGKLIDAMQLGNDDQQKTLAKVGAKAQAVGFERVLKKARELGFEGRVLRTPGTADFVCDLVFLRGGEGALTLPLVRVPVNQRSNDPLQNRAHGNLVPQLKTYLTQHLPDYMVPSTMMALETWPRTPNGKLDRKALPKPQTVRLAERVRRAPTTETELRVAAVWQRLLDHPGLGADSHFFASGGHSLLAMRVIADLREATGKVIEPRALFAHPVLEDFAAFLDARSAKSQGHQAIPLRKGHPTSVAPLSPAQQRLWLIEQMQASGRAYHVAIRLDISGSLATAVLQRSLKALMARHDQLRVGFHLEDGEPLQRLNDALSCPLKVLSFSDHPRDAALVAAEEAAQVEADKAFDLSEPPLFRVTLAQISNSEAQLWLTFHHAIVDGWSLSVFARDFAQIYNAMCKGTAPELPEVRLQYADVAAHLAQRSEDLERQLQFWTAQLKGMPHALKLPRTIRGAWDDTRAGVVAFEVPELLHRRMQALQEAHGATAFMAYLAAFQVLLSKYGCGLDIPVATPHAGRDQHELEALIGFFVNTLVIRGDLHGNPSFLSLLSRLRATALAAFANRDVPFERVVEALQPERVAGSNPLTQVLFAMQNAPTSDLPLEGARIVGTHQDLRHVRFDMELHMWATDASMQGQLIYRAAQFDPQTMQRMVQHFLHLLGEILRHPEDPVLNLTMMDQVERQHALALGTVKPQLIDGQTIHGFFEASAAKYPDRIALRCPFTKEERTYGALDRAAQVLAGHFQAQGAGPEKGVAFFLERDADLLVTILAILKSGAFYVPLDPAYDSDRNLAILEDSGVSLLISKRHLLESLPRVSDAVSTLILEDLPTTSEFKPPQLTRQNLAYLIYTSGSTGKPKGVAVTHGVTVTMLNWARDAFSAQEREAVAGVSSVCFDMSILELFGGISWGGSLVLLPDALSLLELDDAVRITHINTVPSVMAELVQRGIPKPETRLITLGGEPLTATLVKQIEAQHSGVRIVNMFGPAEDGYTSWTEVSPGQEPDLGAPIHNTRMYVLDEQGNAVPQNVGGEICMAGDGTARGYFGKPALTAAKFTPDPYGTPGSRLYRSGDLGKWDADGKLHYLGRSDHQIKIRGFRVEPGEVESLLAFHEDVAACVVMAHREQAQAPLALVAFVVPNQSDTEVGARLLTYLRSKLPSFMVPSVIELLPTLPRNPNGKIDRARLARMPLKKKVSKRLAQDFNRVQKQVHQAWLNVLGIEEAGLSDNFFDLGGHSLLMLKLRESLVELFERDVPLTELFRLPTIQQQADYFEAESVDVAQVQPIAEKVAKRSGNHDDEIAIVGFAGRFPGADDIETFWQNLRDGVDAVQFLDAQTCLDAGADPEAIKQAAYVKAAMPFDDYERFDHSFFGYSKSEAIQIDPQHRHFLEVCWHALEHAGVDIVQHKSVGVFAGCDPNYYFLDKLLPHAQASGSASAFRHMIGNDKDYLATRVAYKLDLKGPALTVQTACSTSLSAVHLACRAIAEGECQGALAGGVSIAPPDRKGYLHEEGMIHSRDGHCRAFDANAGGTMGGHGAAAVMLMSRSIAQSLGLKIYAVIRASAMNNDGSDKVGYTAPAQTGQAEVIYRALRQAGVAPESVGYVEAHGTGTPLGDPIEVAALQQAYKRAGWRGPSETRIGSLKTNIGHMGAAAGVSGLIKAVLCLHHQSFVPSLHFEQPNPEIDFSKGPFRVSQTTEPWPAGEVPRRAGVSAFGIGGTNVHVILEEGPHTADVPGNADDFGFPIAAKDVDALLARAKNLARIVECGDPAGLAFQLQNGLNHLPHRMFLRREHLDAQHQSFKAWPRSIQAQENCRVAFVFPGIHANYAGAAKPWVGHSAVFAEALAQSCDAFESFVGFDVKAILLGDAEIASPRELCDHVANFCFAYAISAYFKDLGVVPSVVLGQSFGEWPAATVAGFFDLATAANLVVARGSAISEAPAGSMLLVSGAVGKIEPYLAKTGLVIAAMNAHDRIVVSGAKAEIEQLQVGLKGAGIACSILPVQRAYHHALLEPAAANFEAAYPADLQGVERPGQPLMFSTLHTHTVQPQDLDQSYWRQQMLQPVRLEETLQNAATRADVFIEMGPDGSFTRALKRYWRREGITLVGPHPKQFDPAGMLGELWSHGVYFDWQRAGSRATRMPTPGYPFKKVLLAPDVVATRPIAKEAPLPNQVSGDVSFLQQQIYRLLGDEAVADTANLFEAGFDSLMMVELLSMLSHKYGQSLSLADVLETPSIAAIQAKLESRIQGGVSVESGQSTPNLIPLSTTHQGPPLFLIHPIGGSALIYRDLAKHLAPLAVVGCHAPGLVPDQEPVANFQMLVQLYLEQILHYQPQGPYLLGGSSFGGMLAYSVATKLQQQGRTVNSLVMMDVLGPEKVHEVWRPQHLFDGGQVSVDRLRDVSKQNQWASQWLSPDQRSAHLPEQVLRVLAAHIEAIHQFDAPTFEGEIHYLRAKDRLNLPAHPELEWYAYSDAMHIRNVPGNHFDMMLGEYAAPLGKAILRCLKDYLV